MHSSSRFYRFPLAFALILVTLQFGLLGRAAAQAQVVDPSVEYSFGGPILFKARIVADKPVKEALILFRMRGDTQTIVEPVEISPEGQLEYRYDSSAEHLRAFSQIDYWFQLTLDDGQNYTSPTSTFYYEDNRYRWQEAENEPFRVHWYEGDLAFAHNILDVAHTGLRKAQGFLPVPIPENINIYVYPSASELQATLLMSGQNWVAGHADPDLGVSVVSLPVGPDQRLEAERQIPHELMHISLYQLLGPAYENLPVWLNEGLASITELYPNPDFQILLENAYQNSTLLPLASLCQSFPVDASGALLSYAESASFTRYLYRQFGSTRLEALVKGYADGLGCERGIEAALGIPLSQLESDWLKETFGEIPPKNTLGEAFTWIIALSIAFISPFLLIIFGMRRRKDSGKNNTASQVGSYPEAKNAR